MKPSSRNIGKDPTIMGNEKPRVDDTLPEGEKIEDEDPRNGMNRPVGETRSDGEEKEKDAEW